MLFPADSAMGQAVKPKVVGRGKPIRKPSVDSVAGGVSTGSVLWWRCVRSGRKGAASG